MRAAKSRTNARCMECRWAYNAVNGRRCTRLKAYVEYAETPPCMADRGKEQAERTEQ